MSPRRSRSRSPHREERRYKREPSFEKSHGSRHREGSSSSSFRESSRSKSPVDKHKRSSKRKDERSRTRSYSPQARRSSRDREDPSVCHCLGVFGLSSYTTEKDLRDVFSQYGDIDDISIIYDRQSGQSKGYGFVYYKSTSDAVEARRNTQGLVLDRRPIRVDYSLTVRPHSPTPGRYLGRRSNRDYERDNRDNRDNRDRYYSDEYDDRYRDSSYRDNRRSGYRDYR